MADAESRVGKEVKHRYGSEPLLEWVAYGRRLKEMREGARLSQQALAKLLFRTQASFSRIENGVQGPIMESEFYEKLARTEGIDTSQVGDLLLNLLYSSDRTFTYSPGITVSITITEPTRYTDHEIDLLQAKIIVGIDDFISTQRQQP